MPAAPPLTALEAEVIHLFVELGRLLGQPRSYAEIYGLLFISARPLAMDHLIERLRLSKGSASQGLKFLRNAGAIRPVYVAGDRRVHYEAVAELRNLATRFLRDQVLPRLDAGLDRMDRIAELVRKMPPRRPRPCPGPSHHAAQLGSAKPPRYPIRNQAFRRMERPRIGRPETRKEDHRA